MADFNFITSRLATGGRLTGDGDVAELIAAGITCIIDCQAECDDMVVLARHPDLSVLWCPTADDHLPKPPSWFGKGITFALANLAHPYRKVYCHCYSGAHRGPSMSLAILLALGLDLHTAEDLIVRARPKADCLYRDGALAAVQVLGYVPEPTLPPRVV